MMKLHFVGFLAHKDMRTFERTLYHLTI